MTVQVVRQLHAVFSIASKLSEKISAARQRFRDSFKQFRFRIRCVLSSYGFDLRLTRSILFTKTVQGLKREEDPPKSLEGYG